MIDPALMYDNLLSPTVLCFALGVIAAWCRSDLKFPGALTTALSTYLLFAIGLKGGESLRDGESGIIAAGLLTLVIGTLFPLGVFALARYLGRWQSGESASLAAHYGSTSAVTFLATMSLLDRHGMEVEGYLPALLAIMEIPAILVGLALAKWGGAMGDEDVHGHKASPLHILVHIITGKTVLLLVGGMIIGLVSAPHGLEAVKPFFVDPFSGILALFLLELGLLAGGSVGALKSRGLFLVPLGILYPLIGGGLAIILGQTVGLSVGGSVAFGMLAGSASYIAAPAAMRMACPDVDHGISLTGSLAITFPFNLTIGIPLLTSFGQWYGGG